MTETERLYVQELLTMEEIGQRFGISRQAVKKRLNKLEVAYRGGEIERQCRHCKGSLKARRKAIRKGIGLYCSTKCYSAARSLSTVTWRQGQRIAREVMNAKPGEVVHHIDGDHYNSHPSNLILFAGHSEHMKYHHSLAM